MENLTKEIEDILKQAQIAEYKAEAKLIIESVSGLSKEAIILGGEIQNKDRIIEIATKRAQTLKPIQYILGFSYFMGEKYFVNNSVLIPRDETEFLVNCTYEKLKNKQGKINVLDIGTGSGCISIELAKKLLLKNPKIDIEILAVDISLDAIQLALKNVQKFDLVRRIIFRKSDLFSKIRDCEKFDLIVSNPPYIPIKEKKSLQKELSFEPQTALFAYDSEGIEFYKKIIENAPNYLKQDGFLAFELGINQSALVETLLKDNFKNIEIIKDLAKIDRVISAQKKD